MYGIENEEELWLDILVGFRTAVLRMIIRICQGTYVLVAKTHSSGAGGGGGSEGVETRRCCYGLSRQLCTAESVPIWLPRLRLVQHRVPVALWCVFATYTGTYPHLRYFLVRHAIEDLALWTGGGCA